MAGIEVSKVHDGFSLIDKGSLNCPQQTWPIAFDRQQVIRLLAHDLPGDRFLTPHGINTDQEALEIERIQQFRWKRMLSDDQPTVARQQVVKHRRR